LLIARRRVQVAEASARRVSYAVGLADRVVAGAFGLIDGAVRVDFGGTNVGNVWAAELLVSVCCGWVLNCVDLLVWPGWTEDCGFAANTSI